MARISDKIGLQKPQILIHAAKCPRVQALASNGNMARISQTQLAYKNHKD